MKIYTLIFVIVGTFFAYKNVSALTYALPEADPWYKFITTLDKNSLPAGISVKNRNELTNETLDPLYFNLDGYPRKLVNGKLYFKYKLTDSEYVLDPSIISVYIIDENTYGLVKDNKIENILQDNRPQNINMPNPVNFAFPAEYKGKNFFIKGQIVYVLNPDYNPHALQERNKNFNPSSDMRSERYNFLRKILKFIHLF